MHTLPKLPYDYNSLIPHIDEKTMEIHHSKHHNAYVTNLNAALEGTDGVDLSIDDLMKNISKYSAAIRNNGGGHYNHSLFWSILSPKGGGVPTGKIAEAIDAAFGNYEKFKEEFSKAAATRFGSGWAWLCIKEDKTLCVCSTPNQDNPVMDLAECKGFPLLGIDVWEHAYYLNYQNRRPDYIAAFFNIINWDEVNARFEKA